MTVAAVILAAQPSSALADASGTPAARRLADVAWAGGATPVVVCSFDPDGAVAAALVSTEAALVAPAPVEQGPAGQIANGVAAALALVAETSAALVWPARMAWVDAETVTSMISAHGADRSALLRPTYRGETGWPALVPVAFVDALRAIAADRMPDDVLADLAAGGVAITLVETGDPGTTHDIRTPQASLPEYDGPPEPADAPEWGAAVAEDLDQEDAR